MKEYIWRRLDTIEEYLYNHPICRICTGEDRMPGSRRFLLWWDQYLTREKVVDGARKGAEREVR